MKYVVNYSDFIFESKELEYLAESNDAVLKKRCQEYKNRVTTPVTANACDIQKFLINVGHNITNDCDFGNSSATAYATWRYGASEGIKSVDTLWKRMKSAGLDVGSSSGFGPKMAAAIAKEINYQIPRLSKCSTSSSGSWNPKGQSSKYGQLIKNIMSGNTSPYESTFDSRQTFYRLIHELLYFKPNSEAAAAISSFGLKPIHSNWFQAAAVVNQSNALGASDNVNLWIISDDTEEMLRWCGVELLKRNIVTAKEMLLGTLNKSFKTADGKTLKLDKSAQGQTLDNRLVEYEQTELKKLMDQYKSSHTSSWKAMIDGINASFGLPAAPSVIKQVLSHWFVPQKSSTLAIIDAIATVSIPSYAPIKLAIESIANYFNHTFNIESYDHRIKMGKGCVSQLYGGTGSFSGTNLI